jgi:hypothetical protein
MMMMMMMINYVCWPQSMSHLTLKKTGRVHKTLHYSGIFRILLLPVHMWKGYVQDWVVLMIHDTNLITRNTLMHVHSSSCGICFITNSYISSRLRYPVYSATFSPSLYRNSVGNPSTCKGHTLQMVTNHIQWGYNKHIILYQTQLAAYLSVCGQKSVQREVTMIRSHQSLYMHISY